MKLSTNKRITICIITLFIVGSFFFVKEAYAVLRQNFYRFYDNIDDQTPSAAFSGKGENVAASGLINGDVIRIRMSLLAPASNILPEPEDTRIFKLQFKESPCDNGAWTDVGALGSGAEWRGFNNATPADGSTLANLKLSVSDVKQTYEEANNSALMPNAISPGEDGEWDWVVENNNAAASKTWCFRVVDTVSGALDQYINYPTLDTNIFTPESRNWRWYADEENETPTDAFKAENTRPTGIFKNEPIKLRVTVKETNVADGNNRKFKLQFSTSTAFTTVNDVVETGNCVASSLWCYADGVDADNASIVTRLLTDSDTNGTHNESGTSATTFDHLKNKAVEYEFTMKATTDAVNNQTYYFRAFDNTAANSVPLAAGKTYPQLTTFGPVLSFTVAGINSGVVIDGYTTDATSTATSIPFGILVPNQPKNVAQKLTVTHDARGGYTMYLVADGQLRTGGGQEITPISGTNAAPSAWNFSISQNTTGAFGYHPDDDALSGGSTRFQANDTWAQVETTRREIIFTADTIENDVHDILYRVEISALQLEGSYANELIYIVVPSW